MEDTIYNTPNFTTPEINAPLSPVLTSSKKNRKKMKSKIKLINRNTFHSPETRSPSPLELFEEISNNNVKNVNNAKDGNDSTVEKQGNEIVERMKQINELKLKMQNRKKILYDVPEENTQYVIEDTEKLVIEEKKINLTTKNESIENVDYEKVLKIPSVTIVPELKRSDSFTSASGKKINISERSLGRVTKIFDDIFINEPFKELDEPFKEQDELFKEPDEPFKEQDELFKEPDEPFKELDPIINNKLNSTNKTVRFEPNLDLNLNSTLDDIVNEDFTQIIEANQNSDDNVSQNTENNFESQESSKFSPETPEEIEFKKPVPILRSLKTQNLKSGITTTQSLKPGITTTQSLKSGIAATQSLKSGSTTTQSLKSGSTTTQSLKSGSTTTQSLKLGSTTTESLKLGSTTTQSWKSGSTTTQSLKETEIEPLKPQYETQCCDPDFLSSINFSQWVESPKKRIKTDPNCALYTQDDYHFLNCTSEIIEKNGLEKAVEVIEQKGDVQNDFHSLEKSAKVIEQKVDVQNDFCGFDKTEIQLANEKSFFYKKFLEIFNSYQRKKILYPLSIIFYDVKDKAEKRRPNMNKNVTRKGRKRKRKLSLNSSKVYGSQTESFDSLSQDSKTQDILNSQGDSQIFNENLDQLSCTSTKESQNSLQSSQTNFSTQKDSNESQSSLKSTQSISSVVHLEAGESSKASDEIIKNVLTPKRNFGNISELKTAEFLFLESLESEMELPASTSKAPTSNKNTEPKFQDENIHFNLPTTGFSTASGKKINISDDSLKNASKMVREINDELKGAGSSKLTTKINIPDKKEEPIQTSFGFASASGKALNLSDKALNRAQNIFKDLESFEPNPNGNKTLPSSENSFGFSCASGKQLNLSEKALNRAQNILKDLESFEPNPNGNKTLPGSESNFGFSCASGKKLNLSEKALNRAQNLFKDLESFDEKTHSVNKNLLNAEGSGFSCASGKMLNLSDKALNRAQNIFKDLESFDDRPNPNVNKTLPTSESSFGFSSASGKKLNLSEKALSRVQNIFKDLDDQENKSVTAFDTPKNAGFSSASGKKVLMSESTLKKAQGMFEDLQSLDSPNQISNRLNPNKKTFKSPLIQTPSTSNTTPILNRKRSLGVMNFSCRQLDVPETKLKRARLIFEDLDMPISCNSGYSPKTDTVKKRESAIMDNIKKLEYVASSSPLAIPPVLKPNVNTPERSKLVHNQNINTPVSSKVVQNKHFDTPKSEETSLNLEDFESHFLTEDFESSPDKSFLSFSKSVSDADTFKNDIVKEYEHLRLQMSVLKTRMEAFEEQQQQLLEGNDRERTRSKPGRLFKIKTDPNSQRVSLRIFVNNQRPGAQISRCASIQITPQNATSVQFYLPLDPKETNPIITTEDGAKIIPNTKNYVGLFEIESAFKSMEGVSPKLIPENWVGNHFKWIVWKLASMERNFPHNFKDYLNPNQIISQLKYRYDREIDNAQRSALKKIYEMDDSPAKRLVLCVSNIFKGEDSSELELTDGWYSIRTIIDNPLCKAVGKKIKIGTKLMMYGAELQNCQGCSPLEDTSLVRLKINYNSTRRAAWDVRLGYYKIQTPLFVSLHTIHYDGGVISGTKAFIARVYPLTYMEKNETEVNWCNDKAELKKIAKWEAERNSFIEKLQVDIEMDLTKNKSVGKSTRLIKEKIEGEYCPKVLYELMENSADPDSFKEMMSPSQCTTLKEYQSNISLERQSEITLKIKEKLSEAKLDKRNSSPVLKLLLVDPNSLDHHRSFSIWYPNEMYLSELKEGQVIDLYNVIPRNNGLLSSTKKMHIEIDKKTNLSQFEGMKRTVTPIEKILEQSFKPLFNEFDTVGLIINLEIKENQQNVWLCDENNRYLSITILNSQENCCLLEGYRIGEIVAVMNLVHRKSNLDFGQAFATLTTVITRRPQKKHLQTYLEDFKTKLPEDLESYIEHCKNGVEVHLAQILLEFNELQPFSLEECNSTKNKNVNNAEELTLSDTELILMEEDM